MGLVPHHGPVPQARAFDHRSRAYRALIADHGVAEPRPGADMYVPADTAMALQPRCGVDAGSGINAFRMRQVHFPPHQGQLGGKIGPLVPHVAPVALHFPGVHGQAFFKKRGENILAEIGHAACRNMIENFGFQNVNARIDQVGKHPAPGGLFKKPGDAARFVRHHHAVGQRHADPAHHQRGQGLLFPVPGQGGGQIAIGQPVPGQDKKSALEMIPGQADAARRAKGRRLFVIPEAHPRRLPFSERRADFPGLIPEGRPHVRHPVPPQQLQSIAHHRLSQQRYQGLGQVHRQRPEPHALAPRHDDRLYGQMFLLLCSFSVSYYAPARPAICPQGFLPMDDRFVKFHDPPDFALAFLEKKCYYLRRTRLRLYVTIFGRNAEWTLTGIPATWPAPKECCRNS